MPKGELVVEGRPSDPAAPDGDIHELENGHRYQMGTRHRCGVDGCPADIGDEGGS